VTFLPACRASLKVLLGALALALTAQSFGDPSPPRFSAALNYRLHCEGCHKADGSGQPGYVPAFRDVVARFLAIPEGRIYVGRVPGISQSLLDDQDRAAVLNWIVVQFDAGHVPPQFADYTAAEMARYRQDPISQASVERAKVLKLLAQDLRSREQVHGAQPGHADDSR
jgi:hypothetical protein